MEKAIGDVGAIWGFNITLNGISAPLGITVRSSAFRRSAIFAHFRVPSLKEFLPDLIDKPMTAVAARLPVVDLPVP
jgi:hypothetical protein